MISERVLTWLSPLFRQVVAERDAQANARVQERTFHNLPIRLAGTAGHVRNVSHPDDRALVARVINAFQRSIRTPIGPKDSMWLDDFAAANDETHRILGSGDPEQIAQLLRYPSRSMLFYGFDSIQREDTERIAEVPWWILSLHMLTYDSLLQTARAIGVLRVENHEVGVENPESPDPDQLLAQIDAALGIELDFPNIFDDEVGLATARGVISYRAIQAVYQAYRIKQALGGNMESSVVEIGAGLGRTAYYAVRMGVASYTIVDIPLTGVAQGYYLGRVLGNDAVRLSGEQSEARVEVIPPSDFLESGRRVDLVVNVDSLTEMSRETARNYIRKASSISSRFLSINHERNQYTVAELLAEYDDLNVWRSPYWLRRGYVEELVDFDHRRHPLDAVASAAASG